MKATLGRRQYRVCLDVELPDGRTIIGGKTLGPLRQTRLQAKKTLARVRRHCPSAELEMRRRRVVREPRIVVGQSFL